MKMNIRAKLSAGFLAILILGSAVSGGVLTVLSGSIAQLKDIIEHDDVIEQKALEVRYHMLEMSDAMRGYLLDPSNESERQHKIAADEALVAAIEDV